jgi:hypothetical protein
VERGSLVNVAAALLLSALAFAGCAARLIPAPGAQIVPGPGPGAVAREAGVQISAHVDAWTGWPPSLGTVVLPILVTVENGGTVPLRVRRDDFALVTARGARLPARGPYEVVGYAMEPAPAGFAYPRFSFGVGFGAYRGWGVGVGVPLYYGDPFFYDDFYYPLHVRVALPTGDMVQMALPERVLEPGARAQGFLYFDRVKRSAERVDFTARLVDAATGAQIGTLAIPFVVGQRSG